MTKFIVMMMVWTAYLSLPADGSPPSVTYVNSTKGEFFLAKGYVIAAENALVVIPQATICECQTACEVDYRCASWSSHPSRGLEECRLTNTSPPIVQLEQNEHAIYQFFPGAIDGQYAMEADGLLYLYPSARLNRADARAYCAAIPGHRLGIFKTMVQYFIVLSYDAIEGGIPRLVVDLNMNDKGEFVWADGTPYVNTEISKHHKPVVNNGLSAFVIYNRKFDDTAATLIFRFLCQANPKGVAW